MKIAHKRIPSGIENCQQFQNTERLQVPKKAPQVQQSKPTARKQRSNQQYFFQILEDMGLYYIYHMFIQFHCQTQDIIKQAHHLDIRDHCQMFKQNLSALIRQQFIQDYNTQQQSDRIKQLLQEIYNLRRKLSDLDGSINIQSISSLDENINCTTIIQKSKSRSRNRLSNMPNSIQNKLNKIQIVSQQVDKSDFDEIIANFMEMKAMIFQLLSFNWRLIHIHLPDEAKFMFQSLNNLYKNELSNVIQYYSNNMAQGLLDSLSMMIFISRECVQKILLQQFHKKH